MENEEKTKRNKNRKKRKRGMIKGSTKNMLMFLQRLIIDYILKYIPNENIENIKKYHINLL
jgi:hypothetical protein